MTRTIKTTLVVMPNRTATLELPADIAPGSHDATVVIQQELAEKGSRPPLNFPVHNPGNWPNNLSLRREDMYGDDGR